ncbi:MAG TPA: hypothetical protein VGY58_17745 [Gemmataceae bacterium]|nr:hypothetical protein [Gemmataceae bacterium]
MLNLFADSRPPRRRTVAAAGLALLASLGNLQAGLAARNKTDVDAKAAHPAAATSTCAPGLILRQAKPDKPWDVVRNKEALQTDDLLLGMPGARLQTTSGVELIFLTDLDTSSPSTVKEAAIILHEPRGADLSLTLDRGRVALANRKDHGPARVRLQVRDSAFELTLPEPNGSVALELNSGWLPGTSFQKNPGPGHAPFAELVVIARKGTVNLKHGASTHALQAPPGPALMEWDSVAGLDASPHRLDKLPSWVATVTGAKAPAVESFRAAAVARGVEPALDQLLASDNEADRGLAVVVLGATDHLGGLAKLMTDVKRPHVWESAVPVLRHWIGRGPGQDLRLYDALKTQGQLTPAQGAIILRLLHSFSEAHRAQPETYELLIDLLESEQPGIRGLAYWHLERLAPAGRKLGYRPLAPKEEQQQALEAWRKLIPAGHLPPRSVSSDR